MKLSLLLLSLLYLVACVPTPTPGPTPTCNPWPTMWPTDIEGPDDWGTICPSSISPPRVLAVAHTVYGRVTVREGLPLPGAKIYVNRIADGTHSGAGFAVSDGDGEYQLEITGHADALRIWVVYPAWYKPWGVTAPIGAWGLTTIHWKDPPASCGPIHWKAVALSTPTPSVTPTATQTPTITPTPTLTLTPTQTLTPSVTPTATETQLPTATRAHTATPTATLHAVEIPQLLNMTPASTQLELMQQQVIIGVRLHNILALTVGAFLVFLAAMGFVEIKRKEG